MLSLVSLFLTNWPRIPFLFIHTLLEPGSSVQEYPQPASCHPYNWKYDFLQHAFWRHQHTVSIIPQWNSRAASIHISWTKRRAITTQDHSHPSLPLDAS
jgi:hypothetical protein